MSTLDLTIDRLIKAPRAKVWDAWSNPDHLKEWWMPRPWTTDIVAFDMRPGGLFHIVMRGPDGTEMDTPGLFLEVAPAEKIIFTSTLMDDWRPGTPWMPLTAVSTMADEDGHTRYNVRVMHKDDDDRKRHEEMGFHDGWGTVVTQLEEFVLASG